MTVRIVAAMSALFLMIAGLAAFNSGPIAQAGESEETRLLERYLHEVATRAAAQPQAQTHGFLIDIHNQAGVTCTACHAEQAFTEPVVMQTCMECHGTYQELAALTPWEPNPHHSHMGEIECSACHNIHKASVSFCDECHAFGMQVP